MGRKGAPALACGHSCSCSTNPLPLRVPAPSLPFPPPRAAPHCSPRCTLPWALMRPQKSQRGEGRRKMTRALRRLLTPGPPATLCAAKTAPVSPFPLQTRRSMAAPRPLLAAPRQSPTLTTPPLPIACVLVGRGGSMQAQRRMRRRMRRWKWECPRPSPLLPQRPGLREALRMVHPLAAPLPPQGPFLPLDLLQSLRMRLAWMRVAVSPCRHPLLVAAGHRCPHRRPPQWARKGSAVAGPMRGDAATAPLSTLRRCWASRRRRRRNRRPAARRRRSGAGSSSSSSSSSSNSSSSCCPRPTLGPLSASPPPLPLFRPPSSSRAARYPAAARFQLRGSRLAPLPAACSRAASAPWVPVPILAQCQLQAAPRAPITTLAWVPLRQAAAAAACSALRAQERSAAGPQTSVAFRPVGGALALLLARPLALQRGVAAVAQGGLARAVWPRRALPLRPL